MKYIIAFTLLTLLVVAKTDLEEVQDMLLALKNDIHEQIMSLDKEWQLTQKLKQLTIQQLKDTKNERIEECNRRDQAIIDKQNDIQDVTDFIAWIQHRMQVNKSRIQILEELQCKQSLNFIDTIRDDKVSLTVSIFVREQIARIISEGTSFAQKTQAMRNIIDFLQNLHENKYDLLELQRNIELEMEDKTEADMGPIEFQKFQEAKDELLSALDDLEKHINQHIPIAQNDMIRVGIAFYEWKLRTLKENEVFELKLEELNKLLQNYEDQLTTLEHSSEQCKLSIGDIDRAIEIAKQDAFLAFDQYTNDHDRLIKELAIFQEIYKMYDRQVDNVTTEAEKEALSKIHAPKQEESTGEQKPEIDTVEEETIEAEEVDTVDSEIDTVEEETIEAEEIDTVDSEVDSEIDTVEEETIEAEEVDTVEEETNEIDTVEEETIEADDIQEELPQDTAESQDTLIQNGPLKLRDIEYDRKQRSDFILLQMNHRDDEELDEVIL